MITKATTHYFKKFKHETFDLSEHLVLAGPNNSGKTTLLQAIVVWQLALKRWEERRGSKSGSSARERTGVPITRKDFTAIPLREMNLLWSDTQTALKQDELEANQKKQGSPRVMSISLDGKNGETPWSLCFEFRYSSSEQLYVKPSSETIKDLPLALEGLKVVHVPPFSGIGVEETKYDEEYQNLLIGQGKPGDILRNLLYEVSAHANGDWEELKSLVAEMFGWQLLPPKYPGRPFILCEYLPGSGKSLSPLDISSAGSGFLQVLLILAFIYARPATLLLLDEPDAHLHVVLQKQIYDRIRSLLSRRKCQMIIATHSEVLIDSTDPSQIISFYSKPHHLLLETDRDQVREALKRLVAMDLLLAEGSDGVLYTEGESDFDLLRAWAKVLGHPLHDEWFNLQPFWHNNQGRNPREARAHFFALHAIRNTLNGYLLLDGDNRALPDREVAAEGLVIGRWKRYEAESYLVHPNALARFLAGVIAPLWVGPAEKYLAEELPPAVLRDPMGEHDYLNRTPASKTLLPGYFNSAKHSIKKSEYYLIAEQMRPEEVNPEVVSKLDEIAAVVLKHS